MNLSKVAKRAILPIVAVIVLVFAVVCGTGKVEAATTFTETLTLPGIGGSVKTNKQPNPYSGMTVTNKPWWVTSVTNSPSGMYISAETNTGLSTRTGTVSVTDAYGQKYEYKISQPHGHSYKNTTIESATYTTEGKNRLQCSCGASMGSDITVPKVKAIVTLVPNGGDLDPSKTTFSVTYGDKYLTLGSKTPYKKDYVFLGWFTSAGKKVTESNVVEIAGDHKLYARWGYLFLKDTSGTKYKTLNATVGSAAGSYKFDIDCSANGYNYHFVKDANSTSEITQPKWITSINASGNTITIKYSKNTTTGKNGPAYLYVYNESLNTYAYCILTQEAPATCKVSFDPKGGSEVKEKTLVCGEKYGELPTTNKKGYKFLGWYPQETGGNQVKSENKVPSQSSQKLYARWEAISYPVKFESNGGSNVGDYSIKYDSTFEDLLASKTPSREGGEVKGLPEYQFIGWYWYKGTAGGTKIQANTKMQQTGTPVLYAHWLKRLPLRSSKSGEYTFASVGKGDNWQMYFVSDKNNTKTNQPSWITKVSLDPTTGKITIAYNANIGKKDRYALIYVCDKNSANGMMYKIWQEPLQATLDARGGMVDGSSKKTIAVAYGEEYGTLPKATRAGKNEQGESLYKFIGWYRNGGTGGTAVPSTVKDKSDHTLYAHWLIRLSYYESNAGQYTIKLDDIGNNWDCFFLPFENQSYEEQIVTVDSKYDPVWAKVTKKDVSNGKITFSLENNKSTDFNRIALLYVYDKSSAKATVYKIVQKKTPTYTVRFWAGDGEWANKKQYQEETYKLGDKILTEVPTKEGYRCVGWSTTEKNGSVVYKVGGSFTEYKGANLYPVWEVWEYTITYSLGYMPSHGASKNAVTTSSSITSIDKPFQERGGYKFLYWEDKATNKQYKVGDTYTDKKDVELVAVWRAYKIAFDLNSKDGKWDGNAPKTQAWDWSGWDYHLPSSIPQNAGFTFIAWNTQKDGSGDFFSPGESIILWGQDNYIKKDITLYAIWRSEKEVLSSCDDGYTYQYNEYIKPGETIKVELCIPEKFSGYYRLTNESATGIICYIVDENGDFIDMTYGVMSADHIDPQESSHNIYYPIRSEMHTYYLYIKNLDNVLPIKTDIKVESENYSQFDLGRDKSVVFQNDITGVWDIYICAEDYERYLTDYDYSKKLLENTKSLSVYIKTKLENHLWEFLDELVTSVVESAITSAVDMNETTEMGFSILLSAAQATVKAYNDYNDWKDRSESNMDEWLSERVYDVSLPSDWLTSDWWWRQIEYVPSSSGDMIIVRDLKDGVDAKTSENGLDLEEVLTGDEELTQKGQLERYEVNNCPIEFAEAIKKDHLIEFTYQKYKALSGIHFTINISEDREMISYGDRLKSWDGEEVHIRPGVLGLVEVSDTKSDTAIDYDWIYGEYSRKDKLQMIWTRAILELDYCRIKEPSPDAYPADLDEYNYFVSKQQ